MVWNIKDLMPQVSLLLYIDRLPLKYILCPRVIILSFSSRPETQSPSVVSSRISITLNSTALSTLTVLMPNFPWSFKVSIAGEILWENFAFYGNSAETPSLFFFFIIYLNFNSKGSCIFIC